MAKRSGPFLSALLVVAVPGLAAGDDDPLTPVREAYRLEQAAPFGRPLDEPNRTKLFSRRLSGLVARDNAYSAESGDVGNLDFDPLLNGQDGEIRALALRLAGRSGDHAWAEAEFTRFQAKVRLRFDLVQEEGGWRIDDIHDIGSRPPSSLVEILATPYPCGSTTRTPCQK